MNKFLRALDYVGLPFHATILRRCTHITLWLPIFSFCLTFEHCQVSRDAYIGPDSNKQVQPSDDLFRFSLLP